ncbi:hypothetical protein [Methylocystis sp. SB2]|uniref:hypothetical protein n=1 Tax=Methylocystis sp. (strain SB2) TaxID=743836 RepID=UPI0003FAECBA|nr:hypothetical protein [Methylocystis sp. SB2]ULO22974.1 hypothetical protein LNB28_12485 [Methylocystis sp. SB2]
MMSAERRELISARTKAAMASPEVRKRISERTKLGMAARAQWAPELHALEKAWRDAGPLARRRFFERMLCLLSERA